jgi:hypothetical protein
MLLLASEEGESERSESEVAFGSVGLLSGRQAGNLLLLHLLYAYFKLTKEV